MRTRPLLPRAVRVLVGAVAVVALTACGEHEPPTAETVASDPGTTAATETPMAAEPVARPTGGVIAGDVPLDLDLWDSGDGEHHAPYRPGPDDQGIPLEPCGERVWPLAQPAPVDQLWAWATGPEYGDRRELVVLPTVDAAVAAVQAFRNALADCEREGHKVWTEHDADTGDDSMTFTESYTDGLGLGTYQVTRVGNAVLYTVGYGEGAIGDAPQTVLRRTRLTRAITASLCHFSQAGCGSEDRTEPAPAIPDGFPLAAGWPRRTGEPGYQGLTGPNRTLPALDLAPCDVPAQEPEPADRLRADWEDIEDFRSRQLTTYRTVAAASRTLDAIAATYDSCPEHASNPQSTTSYAVERTSYGDESWSVAATETYDGYSTCSLGVWHFIRVGVAVLVTADRNEGGAAPPGTLERFVRAPATAAESVIAAMCVFTTTGC